MKITIDEKVCTKHKMTDQEVLIALAVRAGKYEQVIQNMLNREILVEDEGQLKITQHWSDVVEEVLCDSGGNLDDDRLLALAEKIQECYPSGFKRGERGTKYYHKSNKNAIKQALKKFITYYGDYPDEDIIDATKRYVASFKGDYRFPFLMANYFVLKDMRTKGGDITSQLATFLENKEEEDENMDTEDWTTKVI